LLKDPAIKLNHVLQAQHASIGITTTTNNNNNNKMRENDCMELQVGSTKEIIEIRYKN